MKIKSFLILVYSIVGFVISATTAFMTFVIIGTPIGIKMFLQIVSVVLLILPIVVFISYVLGKYLSDKFTFVKDRLENIKNEDFAKKNSSTFIREINDINEHMNFLADRLNGLIKDLKQKNLNLSNLLVSLAHDVKTPITILNGYLEEMEDGMIQEIELEEAITHMKDEIKFLDELTVDILQYINSMQNSKAKEYISLHTFLNDEIFTIIPKNSYIDFINEIERDFVIIFNRTDLKKVCLNLLSNAIKYTKEGYIKIYNSKESICFENSGKKIDEEFKDKIFEPFFTISKSKNRSKSGFGIGLSIVKNLSYNNGYKIYLFKSDEKSTIFILEEKQL